jgi:hypothetical protein
MAVTSMLIIDVGGADLTVEVQTGNFAREWSDEGTHIWRALGGALNATRTFGRKMVFRGALTKPLTTEELEELRAAAKWPQTISVGGDALRLTSSGTPIQTISAKVSIDTEDYLSDAGLDFFHIAHVTVTQSDDTITTYTPPDPTWGAVIMDHNANSITSLADSAREGSGSWPDDAFGGSHPGNVSTNLGGMEYRTTGFGGGAAPRMLAKTSNYGDYATSSYANDETMYLLVSKMTGAGTGISAARVQLFPGGGPAENMGLYLQSNQKFYMHAGGSSFGTPQAEGTITVNPANTYILRITHARGAGTAKLFVNGTLDISLGDALIVNGWFGADIIWGSSSDYAAKLTAEYHSRVRYNKAHETAGLNAKETAILARAGF